MSADLRAGMNVTGPAGPARPGYDHSWFEYQPLPARSPRPWPGDRPVAVAILLDVRAAEWEATPPAVPVPGGRGQAPYPDFPRMSHREFGHRVGVFRLATLLAEVGLPWSAVLDVLTAEHYPAVRDLVLANAAEVVAGGLSVSRPITSLMSEEEELDYIRASLSRLEDTTGVRPLAWMGPGWSESARTPAMLARAGIETVLGWTNDEQPYPMTGAAPLWSVPVSWELCDVAAMHDRQVDPEVYAASITDAVDVLARDGVSAPRMLCLHLHPWLSGEPFRARALRAALTSLAARDDVWLTTPSALADHGRGV
jgi:peptidoglycan/xylan/chitin deacetylase (PgdA/CDA1 family)